MPDLWGRLLVEHTPDPTGRRCQACTTAGTGSPGAAWPCRIRDAAESARARYLRSHPTEVAPLLPRQQAGGIVDPAPALRQRRSG